MYRVVFAEMVGMRMWGFGMSEETLVSMLPVSSRTGAELVVLLLVYTGYVCSTILRVVRDFVLQGCCFGEVVHVCSISDYSD